VARFLVLWSRNPVAPWPEDPAENSRLMERLWAGVDDLIKKGEIKEFGYFLDGASGYAIGEGGSTETFRNVSMFSPYIECEVNEIISYEKAKESLKALMRAQERAAKE
jgi:hypothetical protein